MKTEQRVVKTTWYVSETDPSFATPSEALGWTLAWADEHCPLAYKLVTQGKGVYGHSAMFHYQRRAVYGEEAVVSPRVYDAAFVEKIRSGVVP